MSGRRLLLIFVSVLALPGSGAVAEEGVLAELPFLDEIPAWGEVGDGHIALDLSPNPKRSFALLLDTGASHSMVTPRYARKLGVSVRRTRDRPYERATILGRDVQFWVDDRSSDTSARQFEVGLLGGNFLQRYVVEVDYARRLVRFLDPKVHPVSQATAEAGEIVVPMRFTSGRPMVEIEVGSGAAWFLMDTGAPMELTLSAERARALSIEVSPDAPRRRGLNLYGSDQAAVLQLDEARVGSMWLREVELEVALREGSSYRITNIAGPDQALLGNAFLRRFRVRIDYPNRKLGLLPVAAEPRTEPETPVGLDPSAALPTAEAGAALRTRAPVEEGVFLEVEAPVDGHLQSGPVAWTEVRGWAGAEQTRAYDIAVVVDVSGSTAYASGIDVDGDGKLGKARKRQDRWRRFNPRHLCSDPGDTVLDAELVATRRLLDVLDLEHSRIALVTFADRGHLHAAAGTDRASLDDLLSRLEGGFGSGATNFEHATRLATDALVAASEGEEDPPNRVILFLSDGYPTFPGSEKLAAQKALEAARDAAQAGVRIYTFGLGLGERREGDVFERMAELTGGSHLRLATPGEVIHALPRIDLARVAAVEIENATTGATARAGRVFPDGSYDAYVKLVPGENVLRVTARGERGGEARAERRIRFERREPADAREAEAFAAQVENLKEALRARTLETELAVRAERGETPQEKELDVSIDETEEGPPSQ